MRLKMLVLAALLGCVSSAMAPATAQIGGSVGACPSRAVLDAAPQLIRSGDVAALADFQKTATCHHWITFYFAAEALFKSGDRDQGVRWFYVGQIRGRTVAKLGPNSSTPSMIQALQYTVGQPLNQYAGGDHAKYLETMDWAIDWDKQNPMSIGMLLSIGKSGAFGSVELDFSPSKPLHFEALSPKPSQAAFDEAYAKQREGIANLRKSVADISPEDWMARRKANGLN